MLSGITPIYAPPEIRRLMKISRFKRKQMESKQRLEIYDEKTDIYSFGWVLWAIFYRSGNWMTYMTRNSKKIRKDELPGTRLHQI